MAVKWPRTGEAIHGVRKLHNLQLQLHVYMWGGRRHPDMGPSDLETSSARARTGQRHCFSLFLPKWTISVRTAGLRNHSHVGQQQRLRSQNPGREN